MKSEKIERADETISNLVIILVYNKFRFWAIIKTRYVWLNIQLRFHIEYKVLDWGSQQNI